MISKSGFERYPQGQQLELHPLIESAALLRQRWPGPSRSISPSSLGLKPELTQGTPLQRCCNPTAPNKAYVLSSTWDFPHLITPTWVTDLSDQARWALVSRHPYINTSPIFKRTDVGLCTLHPLVCYKMASTKYTLFLKIPFSPSLFSVSVFFWIKHWVKLDKRVTWLIKEGLFNVMSGEKS